MVQIKLSYTTLTVPLETLYIPYGSNKTIRPDRTPDNPATLYIPYGSNKTRLP